MIAKKAETLARKIARDRIKIRSGHVVEQFQGLKWVQQIKNGATKRRP